MSNRVWKFINIIVDLKIHHKTHLSLMRNPRVHLEKTPQKFHHVTFSTISPHFKWFQKNTIICEKKIPSIRNNVASLAHSACCCFFLQINKLLKNWRIFFWHCGLGRRYSFHYWLVYFIARFSLSVSFSGRKLSRHSSRLKSWTRVIFSFWSQKVKMQFVYQVLVSRFRVKLKRS